MKLSNDANIKADNYNLENIDTSLKLEAYNSSEKISNLKEDTSKNCVSFGPDIVFFTDAGQVFKLAPFYRYCKYCFIRKIVDPTLKTAASKFSFNISRLSEESLNFLFFRNEDVFVKINYQNKPPFFRGILEKFFSK
ncbi:hypothetical protein QIA30_05485 (plasmid) [Borreliella turdi]|uniref:hypothetical protein n=1 Tax=Borreliella turdi TaxID=57863 RepID=UPI003AEFCF68